MGRLAGYRYREIVKRLKRLGLKFDRQAAGSHEIWFNESLRRYTTIPNHPGNMPEGTLRAILRQAGIGVDEFLDKHSENTDTVTDAPPSPES
jgi:predicted RNA binding protein YcfA (HicA-like mRNA interferase family)